MKTTIDLPVGLVREVKVRAIQEGKSFRDKIAELFGAGLDLLESGEANPRRRPRTQGAKS